jgi:hypothetical protein
VLDEHLFVRFALADELETTHETPRLPTGVTRTRPNADLDIRLAAPD